MIRSATKRQKTVRRALRRERGVACLRLVPIITGMETPSPTAAATADSSANFLVAGSTSTRNDFAVEVFYDGDCPLCMREINMLRHMDKRQRIRFTDIAAADFNAAATGKTFAQLMAEIHGRLPDGRWIIGVEVFRRLYGAVGLGWLVAPTSWPGIRQVADFGYRMFAQNRLRLTGRCLPDAACRVQKS